MHFCPLSGRRKKESWAGCPALAQHAHALELTHARNTMGCRQSKKGSVLDSGKGEKRRRRRRTARSTAPPAHPSGLPWVFLEMAINGKPVPGRIVIEVAVTVCCHLRFNVFCSCLRTSCPALLRTSERYVPARVARTRKCES